MVPLDIPRNSMRRNLLIQSTETCVLTIRAPPIDDARLKHSKGNWERDLERKIGARLFAGFSINFDGIHVFLKNLYASEENRATPGIFSF